jgi:hypothetical protein
MSLTNVAWTRGVRISTQHGWRWHQVCRRGMNGWRNQVNGGISSRRRCEARCMLGLDTRGDSGHQHTLHCAAVKRAAPPWLRRTTPAIRQPAASNATNCGLTQQPLHSDPTSTGTPMCCCHRAPNMACACIFLCNFCCSAAPFGPVPVAGGWTALVHSLRYAPTTGSGTYCTRVASLNLAAFER